MKDEKYEYAKLISEIYEYETQKLISTQDSEHIFSELFEKRMRQLIKKETIGYQLVKFAKTVASIAIVFILISIIVRPTIYIEAAKKIFEKFTDHYEIRFEEKMNHPYIPHFYMKYIPEGYTLTVDEYSELGGVVGCTNINNETVGLVYSISDATENVNGENVSYEEFDYNNLHIYYLKGNNKQGSSMTWESVDKTITFTLTGNLPKDTMLMIIDGISEVEN